MRLYSTAYAVLCGVGRDVSLLTCRASGVTVHEKSPGQISAEGYLIVRARIEIKPRIVLIRLVVSGLCDDDSLNVGYAIKTSAAKV